MDPKVPLFLYVVSSLHPVLAERNLLLLWQSKVGFINRMVQLMRTFYVKLDERITTLNNVRFRYEQGKEFEEGYLMAVIIEKYRQAVEHTKMSSKILSYKPYDLLLRVEMIQRIYLDVYRVVNMMHEIPRKFGLDVRKRKAQTIRGNPLDKIIAIRSLKRKDRYRVRQRRLRLQKLKDMREQMQMAGDNWTFTKYTTKRLPKLWQHEEYGWELAEDYRSVW